LEVVFHVLDVVVLFGEEGALLAAHAEVGRGLINTLITVGVDSGSALSAGVTGIFADAALSLCVGLSTTQTRKFLVIIS
jgi:hypothetical protein